MSSCIPLLGEILLVLRKPCAELRHCIPLGISLFSLLIGSLPQLMLGLIELNLQRRRSGPCVTDKAPRVVLVRVKLCLQSVKARDEILFLQLAGMQCYHLLCAEALHLLLRLAQSGV